MSVKIGADNSGTIALAKNPVHHQRSKHISMDISNHVLRYAVSEGIYYQIVA